LQSWLEKLDLEQKIRLLTGADFWSLHPEPEIGLRRLVTSDGPAGVRGELWDERSTSANVPSPTALAATWDLDRVQRLGRLLAAECRRKGVDVLLAPTVNLQRSPYGGRHFECFSEDPRLTADIGTAYVRGLQSQGVGATVKHFVANDSETQRFTVDMRVGERALRELYLYPFEMIVTEAQVWAVMAAYNGVNGTTMTESPMLRTILQEEWGFDGVTMTDWFAGRSTEPAANAGLDLMMPGPVGPWLELLVDAVRAGRVSEDAIDDKVRRVLRLAERVGALGAPPVSVEPWSDDEIGRELRATAAAGFVLVRNTATPPDPDNLSQTPLLPLDVGALHSIAVLGPNAAHGRTLGGGSALVFPPYTVSPLAGLRAALPSSVRVDTATGVHPHTRLQPADAALLETPDGDEGCEIRFLDAEGTVLGSEIRRRSTFNWNGTFATDVPAALVTAIELRTRLRVPTTGTWLLGASGLGRFRLSADDQEVFDSILELPPGADPVEGLMTPPQQGAPLELYEGHLVDIVLLHEPAAVATSAFGIAMLGFQLNASAPYIGDDAEILHAVTLAAAADVAVVVVGTTEEVESEGYDRTSLALPGRQDELVRRVAAANPRTVVVVNAGAPVLLPWRNQVPAVLLTWFPGQEFGNALVDVLLGVVEPGGRLPTTWPQDEQAGLPSTEPIEGALAYQEGLHIGYRRFLRDSVEPAYWFGHGLGYTTWEYDSALVDGPDQSGADQVSAEQVAAAGVSAKQVGADRLDESAQGPVRVSVDVRNSGARRGREVVQIYLSKPDSALERAVRWLAGHAAVEADPGEKATVEILVPRRAFAHWDTATGSWDVEPGQYEIHIGRSAADLLPPIPVSLT
jgi:beta-glucosidase